MLMVFMVRHVDGFLWCSSVQKSDVKVTICNAHYTSCRNLSGKV
jgi:hypothetical protein